MSCHGPGFAPVAGRSGAMTLGFPAATLRVLLVGGPNVGKSTLFNALTGARQHTTNAPGTTVELATGTWRTAGQSPAGHRTVGRGLAGPGRAHSATERAVVDPSGTS